MPIRQDQLKFIQYDSGNCRAYYRLAGGGGTYCLQDETAFQRPAFRFYRCTDDGEPWFAVQTPFPDDRVEYASRRGDAR
jgi:hypothetical protein